MDGCSTGWCRAPEIVFAGSLGKTRSSFSVQWTIENQKALSHSSVVVFRNGERDYESLHHATGWTSSTFPSSSLPPRVCIRPP